MDKESEKYGGLEITQRETTLKGNVCVCVYKREREREREREMG